MSLINEVPKHPLLIFLEAAIRCNLRVTILDSNTAETPVYRSNQLSDIIERLDEILNAVIEIRVGRFDWMKSTNGVVAFIYFNKDDTNFVPRLPNSNGMRIAENAEEILKKLYDESQFFHNIGYYDAKK